MWRGWAVFFASCDHIGSWKGREIYFGEKNA